VFPLSTALLRGWRRVRPELGEPRAVSERDSFGVLPGSDSSPSKEVGSARGIHTEEANNGQHHS
jgi:hypothetical protein